MIASTQLIQAMLKEHVSADEREADSLRRIVALIESSPLPFSREHFVPGHLTASAIVLDAERRRALLIFHGKLQRWLQPGGHFEPGEEDPSVAAAREVREETGLPARWPASAPVLLDVDVHEIPARKTEPAHFHFDLRMLLIADRGLERIGDGVTQVRWAAPAEFSALDLDPGLARALKKVGLTSG